MHIRIEQVSFTCSSHWNCTNGNKIPYKHNTTGQTCSYDYSSPYFSTVIFVEDSELPKPSPEPMLEYLKRTGANKRDVLYIGDSIYDFQCASNAGVEFGLALWGCNSVKHIQANYFFKTPKDILFNLPRKKG